MAALLKLKPGVVVSQQVVIAAAAINAANQLGLSGLFYITSGRDGVHSQNSLHYVDRALDLRSKHLSPEQKRLWAAAIRLRLGPAYDVILEDEGGINEHLHIEADRV